jgi:hypothetical protein
MTRKIALLLAIGLTIASTFARAQNVYTLSGAIVSADNKPLSGVTIRLFKLADSSLVKVALTDKSGGFTCENLKGDSYKLSATMVGYTELKSEVIVLNNNMALPPLILSHADVALKEVTITGQKAFIEQKIDRTVVNVDALISNAGGTALDVLEKAPGVSIDQNGAVTLKGKGVTVFIDDKPTYISGADLENYLKSLPSSTLDQIELMTNPPARYDAAGNGGVINIRTKKSKIKGFNGSLNLSYIQGVYARTNNSFNMNYRNNKINVFANLGYSTTNTYNNLDINRHFENTDGQVISNFLQNSFTRTTGQSYTGKVGVDYYVSDKTTIGIGLTGLYHPTKITTSVNSQFTDAQNTPDSTIIANNEQKKSFKNGAVNLNYRHLYDKNGTELTADIDYVNYTTNNSQSFVNNSYLPNGTLTNVDTLLGTLPTNINIYSAKMDYNHPFKDGIKLGAGFKSSYTKTDNIADYYDQVDGTAVQDFSNTNHFLYKENINAIYINADKEFKRFTVQLGLRLENTVSNGDQLGNAERPDSVFKRNYTDLFPTFYLQYKLDSAGKNQLGFNYGRRVDRPYYQDLNPFISPIDKFTYYTGNPFLNPSFTNAFEISHTYDNRITTTLSYSKTHDQVDETIQILNGIYYSKPGNIGSSTFKSISVDGSIDPASWFNIHLYGQVSNIHSVSMFYTGPLNTQGTFVYFKPLLQFKLQHNWAFQVDGYYQSKVTNVQFVAGDQKRVNAALSKKLSPSTTLKLVVNDIFHSYVNSGVINNLAQTTADYRNVTDTRTAVISLSYRFGKAIKDLRKHDENGAESEQSRVKK